MSDLVDRRTAIDDLHSKDPSQVWDTADVEVWLNALPSAQPTIEPRAKGHWVPAKGGGCYCSECEEYALDEADGRYISVSVKSNFCPNCGAVMKGEV